MNQKTITLDTVPIPTGPHRIGTAKYDLEGTYRKDFKFPNGRLIPIQIYFPMEKGYSGPLELDHFLVRCC